MKSTHTYKAPEWMEPSRVATEMGFAASCVEHVARKLGVDYLTVFNMLQKHNAFETYIVPGYDVLHTVSREYLNDCIIDYLRLRGENV